MEETATTFWDMLRTGAWIVGSGAGAYVLYQAGRAIYDDVYARWIQRKQDAATIADLEQRVKLNDVRTIPADAQGRYPLLYGAGGIFKCLILKNGIRAYQQSGYF